MRLSTNKGAGRQALWPIAACGLTTCMALVSACISGNRRDAYPLYPQDEPLPESQKLVRLSGYVQFVDGRDVSMLGSAFELLPGPHVIETPAQFGHTEMNVGGMSCNTGHVRYALLMKPGYSYVVKTNIEMVGGSSGRCHVVLHESDAKGVVTQSR